MKDLEQRVTELEQRQATMSMAINTMISIASAAVANQEKIKEALDKLNARTLVLAKFKVNTPDMTTEKIMELLK